MRKKIGFVTSTWEEHYDGSLMIFFKIIISMISGSSIGHFTWLLCGVMETKIQFKTPTFEGWPPSWWEVFTWSSTVLWWVAQSASLTLYQSRLIPGSNLSLDSSLPPSLHSYLGLGVILDCIDCYSAYLLCCVPSSKTCPVTVGSKLEWSQ